MNNQFRLIGEKILETKYEMAKNVHEDRLTSIVLTQEEKKQLEETKETIIKIRADFIGLFGETLHKELD